MRRLSPGKFPDPVRAHGAWVYLIVSVLAGTLSAIGKGAIPALFAGIGFAGVFLVGSAAAIGLRRRPGRLVLGLLLALGSPGVAVLTGADPSFLAYGLLALFPAGLSAWMAERHGFLSPAALAFGVAALVVAAPSAACAGGVTTPLSLALLGMLTPFFAWRTFVIRRRLRSGHGLKRAQIRAIGWREAGFATVWTFLAVAMIHVLS